jgi:hypothetical protein
MCVIAVAAIALASYFTLVQYQTAAVARSQTWNSSLPLAEAGLDEAMALVNKNAGGIITDAWAWTNNIAGDGWTAFTNGQTSVSRTLAGTDGYSATVDITSGVPVISSAGRVTILTVPWGFFASVHGPFLGAQVGNSPNQATSATLGRKVLVTTVLDTLFPAAIVTKSNFNMKGNNTVVDSFDSTDPLAVNGQYTVAARRANGDVATDSSIIDSLHVANGNIYGKVMTGPGTVQSAVQIGSQGAVGSVAWNSNAVNRGKIQPGAWAGDFNVNIPDVKEPGFAGNAFPAATNGYITLNGGNYTSPTAPTSPLKITGPTTVWIQGGSSQNIVLASTNASLILYVGTTNTANSDSLDLHGIDYINSPGSARNLQVYGLPSLTSIDMTGNSGFNGTIYAPSADLKGGGGGNNILDTSGAIIVGSITLNGHWNFHYDEHLKVNGPNRGWIAKDWKEVSSNN